MHATIDVQLAVSMNDDRAVPLAALAEFVTDQNIESAILEVLVEKLEATNELLFLNWENQRQTLKSFETRVKC